MSQEQRPLEPDQIEDWSQWGRQQGARWSEWGKQFGERARKESKDAWSWSQPNAEPTSPLWTRLILGILGLPAMLIGMVLALLLAAVVLVSLITAGALGIWLALGIGSGAIAGRRGWSRHLGSSLGFLLGPIGLYLISKLPNRN